MLVAACFALLNASLRPQQSSHTLFLLSFLSSSTHSYPLTHICPSTMDAPEQTNMIVHHIPGEILLIILLKVGSLDQRQSYVTNSSSSLNKT